MVITGDNQLTAEAICRQIGVFTETEDLSGKSMTGRNFADLAPEKRRAVLEVRLCSRLVACSLQVSHS